MRKLQKHWHSIPRWLRAILNAAVCLIFLYLFYIAIGSPALTPEQAFRRAEKINMVGPSRIVDNLDDSEYNQFTNLIVGETEEGILFFGQREMTNSDSWYPYEEMVPVVFSYREKTGDITVLAAPCGIFGFQFGQTSGLPIYIFDEYPKAVRAELEISVSGAYTHTSNGEEKSGEFDRSFSAEAVREGDGFFRLYLKTSAVPFEEYFALERIAAVSTCPNYYHSLTSEEALTVIPVTVRLYDENDSLVIEKELTIQSAIAEAHAKRGEPIT